MTKLKFQPADVTADQMNRLGKAGVPFVFAFNFELSESLVMPLPDIDDNQLLFEIDGFSGNNKDCFDQRVFNFIPSPPTFEEYKAAFDQVKHHLYIGNTYLINLTFLSKISTDLTLEEIFSRSSAKYKLLLKDHFVVFSPETFVTINQNRIYSYPMKGTISANIPNAEKIILEDPKELAEHYTIVDLIRNDLNIVAKNINVERFRYVDLIKTHKGDLLQISSEISGLLPDHWESQVGTIILKMLPAGSISGAPKQKTVEIINQVETYNRGFYTGIFGYFDGVSLKSAVMIRFIEQTHDGLVFKSGGGITVHSECESEYRELIQKIYVPIF